MKLILGLLITCLVVFGACKQRTAENYESKTTVVNGLTTLEFEQLLTTVAKGWKEGNARLAADCFSDDAVYVEPPDQQIYQGRKALFEFFGGVEGRKDPMNMTWHHLIFDENQQIGTGEYTFAYKGRLSHGIVIIKISAGKIQRWREYQYRSTTEWTDFIGKSAF